MNINSDLKSVVTELLQPGKLTLNVNKITNDSRMVFVNYCRNNNIDITTYNNKKAKYSILPSCTSLERSHNNIFVKRKKPTMGGYEKYTKTSIPSSRGIKFGSNINFTIPNDGRTVSECIFHIKISNVESIHQIRYVDFPGHRILESVKINLPGMQWGYNPELLNLKCHLHNDLSWNACFGQDKIYNFDIYPAPENDKNKIKPYTLQGQSSEGYQTYKYKHDSLDLYIPIFLGLESECSIPLLSSNPISLSIDLTDLRELISIKSNSESSKIGSINSESKFRNSNLIETVMYTIEICEFYTKHQYIEAENWNLIIYKWPTTIITTYMIFNPLLTTPQGNHSFKLPDCAIDNIYVGFRPVENITRSKYWFSNKFIKFGEQKMLVKGTDEELIWYASSVPIDENIVKKLTLTINDTTIDHDVGFLSTYMSFKKKTNPKFGPWYMFTDLLHNMLDTHSSKLSNF